jgi:hypothetical protein
MTTRKELLPGVFLTSIQDGRFKTACFSLSFLRPLRAGEAAMNALLPSVLLRGSEKTPSIRAIANRLDELHGASIGALVRKKGEIQLTGLFADCLEDQYAGEAVFSHLLDFVSELLFCPRTEHGAFVPELVSQECRNLQNAMQSVLDDKSAYCERQLLRAMCRGERYACGRLGEPEELDKIDVRTLWAHDKSVLASSRVELFYLGSKSVGEAEALLQPLLAHLPRTACVPVGTNPSPLPQELRRFSETMPLAQSRISLGFRTDVTLRSAQYPATLLLNAMLGGGEQNRLYTVVRGRMALCYEAGSWYDGHKGILAASAGCGRICPLSSRKFCISLRSWPRAAFHSLSWKRPARGCFPICGCCATAPAGSMNFTQAGQRRAFRKAPPNWPQRSAPSRRRTSAPLRGACGPMRSIRWRKHELEGLSRAR